MSISNQAAWSSANMGSGLLDTESSVVLAGVMKGARDYLLEDSQVHHSEGVRLDDLGGVVEGSEPEYRPYEAVCTSTFLTYNKHLPECPHCYGECSTIETKEAA